MMGAVSAIAENTSGRALVRVEAEKGNQFLHMYRPAESTGSAGIRTTCVLDLTDYKTLHLSFKVKSLGAGASVILYSNAGNSPLYKKLRQIRRKNGHRLKWIFILKQTQPMLL